MNWVAVSFQLKTDPSKRLVYQVKARPSRDLESMGASCKSIHISSDMLSSFPNHTIIFMKDRKCVVSKIRPSP